MKSKNIQALLYAFILLTFLNPVFSQVAIRDRWDTLTGSVNYANTTTFLKNTSNLTFDDKLLLFSDSNNVGTITSVLQIYNQTTNSLSAVNFTRATNDYGISNGASILTNTANLRYVYFGGKLDQGSTQNNFTLYKYNSQTSAVTSESVGINLATNHGGVQNVVFYSPTTNHDSLIVFVNKLVLSDDSVYIYKKHYNQNGLINTYAKLPEKIYTITKTIVFNNVLLVAGHGPTGHLLSSTDGLNFSSAPNFTLNYFSKKIVDMDTINNKLYLAVMDLGAPGYQIVETPDGLNFTTLYVDNGSDVITSLKNFRKTIWFSHHEDLGSKAINSNSSTMNIYAFKPSVSYLNLTTNTATLSIDTIGRTRNQGKSFRIQPLNNKLLLSGNYYDDSFGNTPGTFVYQFVPPTASFVVTNTNVCLPGSLTLLSQSLNSDSIRWIINNVVVSTTPVYPASNLNFGLNTIKLVAISGTQRDTLTKVVNGYSVSVSANNLTNLCLNKATKVSITVTGAIGQFTAAVNSTANIIGTGGTGNFVTLTSSVTGLQNYHVTGSDGNGCSAISPSYSLTVLSLKDIEGTITQNALPVAGHVILYRYEPMFTKFDSVSYDVISATGTYSFLAMQSNSYILKCVPTDNTLQTTYNPSSVTWMNAATMAHGCVANFTQNISVVPLNILPSGPGLLSGKIVEGVGYGQKGANITAPGNPIKGVTVKGGRNPGGDIVAQGKTNSAGEYTLSSFPISQPGESYFILVDIAGLDTNTIYYRAISSSSLQYTNLDFVADSTKITPTNATIGVKETTFDSGKISMYPNPTNSVLYFQFDLNRLPNFEIDLFDVNGKFIKKLVSSNFVSESNTKYQVNISDLNSGIYLVKYRVGGESRTEKLIITE